MQNRLRHLIEPKAPKDRVIVINKRNGQPYMGYIDRIEYDTPSGKPYYYTLIWCRDKWIYATDPMYWELV